MYTVVCVINLISWSKFTNFSQVFYYSFKINYLSIGLSVYDISNHPIHLIYGILIPITTRYNVNHKHRQ